MHAQFVFAAISFGVVVVVAALTVKGGRTALIDAWAVRRPTVPRQWLAAAFWGNLLLPTAACGLFAVTAGGILPSEWNDVAQLFLWLSLAIDAVIAQRRLLLAVSIFFLAFSIYGVTTHILTQP